LRNKNAAQLVCQTIQQLTKPEVKGECMAHIESDSHHMALRVQKIPKPKSTKLRLLITVVETEKKGIVKINDWKQVESILNSWLAEAEPNLKSIIVRTKSVGFKQ